jgi:colanic acid/amylovoran biosynthesis glycosyltransferase
MRIAFLVAPFPCLSETFILNQITGLIDRGHEVDIYALYPGERDKVHPDVETYRLLERTYYVPPIPFSLRRRILKGIYLFLTHFYQNPLLLLRSLHLFQSRKPARFLELLYWAIPLLRQAPYDIIHAQFGRDGLRGLWLREVGAIQGKLITTFRGFDISQYIQEQGAEIYDRLFKDGDFFLANCEFFRHRAIQLGCDPQKIRVHGSGIDCDRFRFSPRVYPEDGKIRIATTGRLVEKKGIEYSIRAVAKLVPSHPHLEYNIIGDGHLRPFLEHLIQDLGMAEVVRLLGHKEQPEIIEILGRSHLFVAASVTAADGNQDAPVNVLKEAMAMGLPVVSTNHGGIPELVEDGVSGFLIPERDVDALATTLGYLMEHPEIWPQMGRAGRAAVEAHYNIHQLNDQLVEIYHQVLQLKDS